MSNDISGAGEDDIACSLTLTVAADWTIVDQLDGEN